MGIGKREREGKKRKGWEGVNKRDGRDSPPPTFNELPSLMRDLVDPGPHDHEPRCGTLFIRANDSHLRNVSFDVTIVRQHFVPLWRFTTLSFPQRNG
jgi:hypothetical protein